MADAGLGAEGCVFCSSHCGMCVAMVMAGGESGHGCLGGSEGWWSIWCFPSGSMAAVVATFLDHLGGERCSGGSGALSVAQIQTWRPVHAVTVLCAPWGTNELPSESSVHWHR